MGFSSLIVTLGNTTGPIVAGVLADRTGNYEAGFTVLAIGALLGSGFFMFAKKPPPPQRASPLPAAPEPAPVH
jgi:hypothetical protein